MRAVPCYERMQDAEHGLGCVWAMQFERSTMSGVNPSRHGISPAAVSLRSDRDDTLVFESRFESGNLAKAVQMYVGHFSVFSSFSCHLYRSELYC